MDSNTSDCTSRSSSSYKPAISNANKNYNNKSNYNRSFSSQRNLEIQMENKLFAKKIEAVKNRCPESLNISSTRKSSAANNQAKKAKEIIKENEKMILRIKNVKSTINK
jgi:hypothetical protein